MKYEKLQHQQHTKEKKKGPDQKIAGPPATISCSVRRLRRIESGSPGEIINPGELGGERRDEARF